jgi:large subunit ribosomal protein L18
VFKSNKAVYAQLIDDEKEKTILAVNTAQLTGKEVKDKTPLLLAELAGMTLAKAAIDLGVKAVVFDRGGFNYQGQIRALADGARKGGLIF